MNLGKPVVVDPKGRDYSIYRGATLITPNRQELADATHSAAQTDEEIAAAAAALGESLGARAVLVTRSEDGMTLVNGDGAVHVPAYPVRVRDVSGAGDTVVAVLAAMLAMKADFESAMRAANAAAAVVVGKRGTATLTVAELRSRILPASTLAPEEKIVFDWALLDEHLAAWRRQGLRIGFTNGCFDLLHPGHVRLLAAARGACDRLVLGLNGDASVTRLKGAGRPVQPVEARAEVLAALEAVDLVVVFDEDTPLELIARVEPTVLVKGGDYTRDQVVGAELVESLGGEVILVDLVPGHSTTEMVKRTRAPERKRAEARRFEPTWRRHSPLRNGKSCWCGSSSPAPRASSSMSAPTIRRKARRAGISSSSVGAAFWSSRSLTWPRACARPARRRSSRWPAPRHRTPAKPSRCTSPGRCRRSTVTAWRLAPFPTRSISVPVRTLDDILAEAGAPAPLPFLSVDVEGHEIEALSGFDFARWRPRLVLLEDHVSDLAKHRFMRQAHYRLVRRTDTNGWYVPEDADVRFGWADRWAVWRKYFLALPFRMFRNFSRRLRQPFKDRRAMRDRAGGPG